MSRLMSCAAVALLFSDKDIYLGITNTLAQCQGLPFLVLNIYKYKKQHTSNKLIFYGILTLLQLNYILLFLLFSLKEKNEFFCPLIKLTFT
jgi:hypothetical protein